MSTLINCEGASIPDFGAGFSDCAPKYVFGEVERVFVTPLDLPEDIDGNPYPADVTDESDWLALFNAGIGVNIPVKGTLDEPERPEIDTSLYRKAYPPARYTLSAMVDDIGEPEVYNALRDMANIRVRFWFISGNFIFGGAEGLLSDLNSWLTIEEGEEAMHKYALTFTWRSPDGKGPERATSPFLQS